MDHRVAGQRGQRPAGFSFILVLRPGASQRITVT
jgi:hypothetical protein